MQNSGENLGINPGYLLSGAIAAIIFMTKTAAQKFKTAIFSIASGAMIANYCTLLIVDLLKLPTNLEFGVAFVLGLSGKRLTMLIINALEEKIKVKLPFLFTKNKKSK